MSENEIVSVTLPDQFSAPIKNEGKAALRVLPPDGETINGAGAFYIKPREEWAFVKPLSGNGKDWLALSNALNGTTY